MNYGSPITLLILCLFLWNCREGERKNGAVPQTVKTKTMETGQRGHLPELLINDRSFTQLGDLHFKHSVGGAPVEEETLVQVKFDEKFLEIKFECRDNPRMDQNHFTLDNSPMYTQEVFELFISKGEAPQEDYLEFQLNPNNAMFLAKINNRFKGDKNFSAEFLDPQTEGVLHSVAKNPDSRLWKGHIRIPLGLLEYPTPSDVPIYRLNFYRIISQEDHLDKDWRNTAENSTYACWSSTMAQRPNFHRPEYFGFMRMVPPGE